MPTNKQRREAARRHLERQLERRLEQEARRKKATLIISIAGTIVLIAAVVVAVVLLGSGKKTPSARGTSTAPTSPSASPTGSATTQAASYPCTWTQSGTAARKVSVPSTTKPPKSGKVNIAVRTTRGTMTFTLNRTAAPCTVASFVSLVKQKYYDNTPCHRLVTTSLYVLQCGDPTGTGTGGPGYTIPDEVSGKEKYTRGVIAMANTGQAHTGGGQFFIVYKQDALPANYTIFGTVTKGLDVVDAVAAKGSNNANASGDGKPKLSITITSAAVAN